MGDGRARVDVRHLEGLFGAWVGLICGCGRLVVKFLIVLIRWRSERFYEKGFSHIAYSSPSSLS